ncbi:MarR family winged helix-turn-helix transcriptional regulator [Curtobacterium sp. SP.BCp]|uniref:MarR family winged helix-turn-helix transcriptional regulator n=1 Tax=Curtobacterium sp. SP.BCp TaxID=3435230 RepID=UPI003F73F2FB
MPTPTDPEVPPGVVLLEAAHELLTAETLLSNRVRARLGLRAADYQALQLIAAAEQSDIPARAKDVSTALGVTAAAATIVADRLVQKDLIVRAQDPDDRRNRTLTLTDTARAALRDAFGSFPDEVQDRLNRVPDSEIAAIRALASDVREILDRTAR